VGDSLRRVDVGFGHENGEERGPRFLERVLAQVDGVRRPRNSTLTTGFIPLERVELKMDSRKRSRTSSTGESDDGRAKSAGPGGQYVWRGKGS